MKQLKLISLCFLLLISLLELSGFGEFNLPKIGGHEPQFNQENQVQTSKSHFVDNNTQVTISTFADASKILDQRIENHLPETYEEGNLDKNILNHESIGLRISNITLLATPESLRLFHHKPLRYLSFIPPPGRISS